MCISAKKVNGVRKLRITLGARYFDRYKLCVTTPADDKTCKSFKIAKAGGVYGDSVRWDTHFPDGGPALMTLSGDRARIGLAAKCWDFTSSSI